MAHQERGGWLAAGLSPRRILVAASVFIIAYFGVSIAGNAVTHYELSRNQDRLRREIAGLDHQQRRLEALKTYMQTDEFIERAARDQGLIRPGDTSVLVSAPPAATPAPGFDGPWWERYFRPEAR